MKRAVLGLVSITLAIFIGTGVPAGLASAHGITPPASHEVVGLAQQNPETVTVYVTKTGAKYHRDGCRYLSRSKIAMSLKEAVKRFEPCKVCRPPVLK